jgi:geranylgeranyl reductase family protein
VIPTDVLIVGAGPAGTAAAIELKRSGRDVVVIDKAEFPRDKCCGDGLTAEALRILDRLGLHPERVPNWNTVTDIMIRGPKGREIRLPLPDTGQYAAIVPRADLDDQLVGLARAAGADVRTGVSYRRLETVDDHVEVSTSDGTFASRYVIAADGMWSPVRKSLGVGPTDYRGEWHAFRQYFADVGPAAQHLVVWFEPDLLPGYAWSFPLPGQRANVGFGILRGRSHGIQDMKRLWEDILERPHIRAVLGPDAMPEGRHKAWPIPARVGRLPLTAERVFFVGDAAGTCDPMTGEGIAQALFSGRAAAEAINIGGALNPAGAADTYSRRIGRDLVIDHRLSRSLARILQSSVGARGALRAADLTPWTRRNFARWMFEDYPRAVALTPRRWHRDMFGHVGAFGSGPGERHNTVTRPVASMN